MSDLTDQELLYILRSSAGDGNNFSTMKQTDLIQIANRLQDKIRDIAELKQSLKEAKNESR